MQPEDIVSHLIDIKQKLASLAEQNVSLKQDLFDHNEATKETRVELDVVKRDVSKVKGEIAEARTVINTLRWVIAFAFVTAPGVAAVILKVYNNL